VQKHMLITVLCVILGCTAGTAGASDNEPATFSVWLQELRQEALAEGISQPTIDRALANLTLRPRIISNDKQQPEFQLSLQQYLQQRITPKRIAAGNEMLRRYPTWLRRVEQQFAVQRRFIVALLGIESNYGRNQGQVPVIQALTTLAYDKRRSTYFRRELLTTLQLLDRGELRQELLTGSWAGAMGQCQFMPSSFARYAVNMDGGLTDIWNSIPDVFASTANYLHLSGWQGNQTWGRPVTLPPKFDSRLADLKQRKPLASWQALGVRTATGRALPRSSLQASLILPDGPTGPAWLVYDNFRVLLKWNRSVSFAVTVGTLADRLADY